jgi:hypothetical protein
MTNCHGYKTRGSTREPQIDQKRLCCDTFGNMSYWEGTGRYQAEYDALFEALVPRRGRSATPQGELLRVLSRMYQAFYNDGDDTAEILVSNGRVEARDLEDAAAMRGVPADASAMLEGLLCNADSLTEETLEAAMDAAVRFAADTKPGVAA